jgi:hypothetical protein
LPSQIDDRTYSKYLNDVTNLKSKFQEIDIAKKLGMKAPNFKHSLNGKRPGKKALAHFYDVFKNILKKMAEEQKVTNASPTPEIGHADREYKLFPSEKLLLEQGEKIQGIEESISRLETAVKMILSKLNAGTSPNSSGEPVDEKTP